MKQVAYLLLAALTALAATGCGGNLFGLNLTVVGERTALERQVLGTYQELGRELTSYSSVRAVQPDGSLELPPPMTESQRAVMMALNNRRYNRDDLDALLRAGVAGEGSDGLIAPRNWDALLETGLQRPLAEQIVNEENRDRGILLDRLMATTPGVTEANRADVAWIFAQLQQDLAPAGAALQNRDGSWRLK